MTDASSTGIPTIAADEMTYRVGWEVVSDAAERYTVRIRRVADPDDSDGVPMTVEAEVSVRGESTEITARAKLISPSDKVNVLMALWELAWRHGHGDLLDSPILVPDGGIRLLVLRWRAFSRWFLELAHYEFADLGVLMTGLPFDTRRGGIRFLSDIAAVVPQLQQFDDTPHLLLQL